MWELINEEGSSTFYVYIINIFDMKSVRGAALMNI